MYEESELDTCISRYILEKTPAEIGEMCSHTPEEVIARAYEMKHEIDSITLETEITFLVRGLNRIARSAEEDANNAANARDKGGLYSAAVSAIKESLRQANILKKENDGAVAELNSKRLRELLRLFDVIVARGVTQIVNEFDVDQDRATEIFTNNIVEAAKELDKEVL